MLSFTSDKSKRKAVILFRKLYKVAIALRARPENLYTSFRDPLTILLINFMLTHATDDRFVGIQDIVQSRVSLLDQNEWEMTEYFLTYAEDRLINEVLMHIMITCEFVPLHNTRLHPFPYLDFFKYWIENEILLTYGQYRQSSQNTKLMYEFVSNEIQFEDVRIYRDYLETMPAVFMHRYMLTEIFYHNIPKTLLLKYPQFTILALNRSSPHYFEIIPAFQETYPEIMKKVVQRYPNYYYQLTLSLRSIPEFAEIALAGGSYLKILEVMPDQLKIDLHDRVSSYLFRFPRSIQYVSTEILTTYPDMFEQAIKGCFATNDTTYSMGVFISDRRTKDLLLHRPDLCISVVQRYPDLLNQFTDMATVEANEQLVTQLCEIAVLQKPDTISSIPAFILHKHPTLLKALYHTDNNDAFKSLPPDLLRKLVLKGLESFEDDGRFQGLLE